MLKFKICNCKQQCFHYKGLVIYKMLFCNDEAVRNRNPRVNMRMM